MTGGDGFLGRNLIRDIEVKHDVEIFKTNRLTPNDILEGYIDDADYIFHFAGEVIPSIPLELMNEGNVGLTSFILNRVKLSKKKKTIIYSSSIHAKSPVNNYGLSKRESELLFEDILSGTNHSSIIYRLPHLFGPYAKPNHNSVITTWVFNAIYGNESIIYDRDLEINYCYSKDIVNQMIEHLEKDDSIGVEYKSPDLIYSVRLGYVFDLISDFSNDVTLLESDFEKKLYSTFQSFK
ncbi:NAD-dependent epimerase/dehydratase family protein [Vibrio aestuarianus]|nr:NAD-dependent epimerase/dehydratase family protein [Vibrio aestuarianus]